MASTAETNGKHVAVDIKEEDGEQERQLKDNEADNEKKKEEEILQFGCCGLFKKNAEKIIDGQRNQNEASTSQNHETQQDQVSNVEEEDGIKEQPPQLSDIMLEKLQDVSGEKDTPREKDVRTIIRLPERFHATNKELWEPRMVSIGPYHRGKENLQAIEKHKWSLLRVFLDKCGSSDLKTRLATCREKMRALEEQARQCYDDEVKSMTSKDFIDMLLLDGCFILEFFLSEKTHCADCDVGWANVIYSDVLLLENQIPYFVIHELHQIECPEGKCNIHGLFVEGLKWEDTKHWLHLCYTKKVGKVRKQEKNQADGNKPTKRQQTLHGIIAHWLHLCYAKMVGKVRKQEKNQVDGNKPTKRQEILHSIIAQRRTNSVCSSCHILCISELHEAGVSFELKKNSNEIFDISFENGIMKIPFLKIDHADNIILWNMVAFEQTQQGTLQQILSSYLALMDSLINTEKDVAILERCGIVENYLQNQADAAHFFNQFGNHFAVEHDDHHFSSLYKDIKAYSSSRWNRWKAKLIHDYFSNPWSGISFGAAAILLVLTILQTFFSQSDLQKFLRKLIH